MKWDTIEPSQGSYNYAPARPVDQLRAAARTAGARAHPAVAQPDPGLADQRGQQRDDQQRPAARHPQAAHHQRGQPLQGQDLAVGRRQRDVRQLVGLAARCPTASTATTSGSPTLARASSPTRSAGRTRPIRRRCCSTTTTTSPARMAPTRRATRCTHGSSRCSPRACRSTASASRATWTRSTASTAPRCRPTWPATPALGLKVAITEADVRTFVETTDGQPDAD